MAKIGKEDPRWLVENRQDGKNVNQWHWTEKNLFPLAKKAFTDLFKDMQIPAIATDDKLVIKTMDSITGDVTLQGRKGRAFFLHDITIKLKWEGERNGVKAKGLVKIIDIISDDDDWVIQITLDKETKEGREMKEHLRATKKDFFKTKVKDVIDAMKDEWLTLAKAGPSAVKARSIAPEPVAKPAASKTFSKDFRTINIKLTFNCPANMLYGTLLDSQRMSAVTGSQAVIAKGLGEFSLFGGSITGKTTKLVENKAIEQDWRFNTWPKDHFSKVVIKLEADGGRTVLTLVQAGVPSDDYDRTRSGWMRNFWQRLRAAFGWGFSLKN